MLHVMTTTSASEIFALVDDRKTPPPQVAGDAHHECKFCICTIVDDWKIHYKFNSCRGSRPSWALYSQSRMQQPIAGRTRIIASSD